MDLIEKIQDALDVVFDGTTKYEASKFISDWIDDLFDDFPDDCENEEYWRGDGSAEKWW